MLIIKRKRKPCSEATKKKISQSLKSSEKFQKAIRSLQHCENISQSNKGRIAWNKDLTKETDNRVKKYSENNSGQFIKDSIPWNKGLTKDDNNVLLELSKNRKGSNNPSYHKIFSSETRNKMSISHEGDKNSAWKGGASFEPYCKKFNEKKREEIRNQYGRKCYICGKLESDQIKEQKERGKRGFRLSVHHVDEDKEQGCNGKGWKLVPLCLSCHNSKKCKCGC